MLQLRKPKSEAVADVPGFEDEGVQVRYIVPDEETGRLLMQELKRIGSSKRAGEFDAGRVVFAKLFIEILGVQVEGEPEEGIRLETEGGRGERLTRECADQILPLFFGLLQLSAELCGLAVPASDRKN